jgi:large subunit ribosomal protein L22
MIAKLRQIRISSKKVNLIAALIRNKNAADASDLLKFLPKKAARPMKKVVDSAIANAVNNFKQKKEDLYIKEIIVNEGQTYKRFQPVSRGRSNPILKRTSHVTVKLDIAKHVEKPEAKEAKTTVKSAAKPKKSTPKK